MTFFFTNVQSITFSLYRKRLHTYTIQLCLQISYSQYHHTMLCRHFPLFSQTATFCLPYSIKYQTHMRNQKAVDTVRYSRDDQACHLRLGERQQNAWELKS